MPMRKSQRTTAGFIFLPYYVKALDYFLTI